MAAPTPTGRILRDLTELPPMARKSRKFDSCPTCGEPKDRRSKRCQACHLARQAEKWCSGCSRMRGIGTFYIRGDGGIVSRCRECCAQERSDNATALRAKAKLRRAERRLERGPRPKRVSPRALPADEKRRRKNESYRRWYLKNRPSQLERHKAYAAANPEKRRAQDRAKRIRVKANPSKWFAFKLSCMIRDAIKRRAGHKAYRTAELLGCSVPSFIKYIEAKLLPGMSWDNWGRTSGCWQLDHVRPVSSFDLSDPDQQRLCFNFSNYQPLWAIDNIRKGATWLPS